MKPFSALLLSTALSGFGCSANDSDLLPGGSFGTAATGGSPVALGGRTGSGGGPAITSGGSGIQVPSSSSGGSGGEPTCGVQDFNRERKPAEVILVLDRSGSMENMLANGTQSRWDATVPTVANAIETTNAGIWWGLKSYPELDETAGCAAESIVPTIHVPIAENNAATVVATVRATTPKGDGTPTGDAIRFALAHLQERANSTDNPKFILLATDGEPTCPSGTALAYTISQISAALAAGFPTFVIGVDTTKDRTIENLNAMAEAGGKPRPRTNPNPVAVHTSFYLASTQAEIQSALEAITGAIASCVFDLKPPPPAPENIAVDFNGVRTDRDPTRQNGWEYTKDDHSQLQVYGTWCDRIKSDAKNQVNIKYGCPNVPIPPPR